MKGYYTLVLMLALASLKLNGQNLVPNPGFENFSSCPQNMGQINLAEPWYSPTGGTPELFNVCSPQSAVGVQVPKNVAGYQFAHNGNGYAGIGTGPFDQPFTVREYISSRLSDTLEAGKKYCVEFYVSLGDSSVWAMDRLAAFFSRDSIKDVSNIEYLDSIPQVESDSGVVYSDTSSWIKISGEFFAEGGERYFIIGNFRADSVTTTDSLPAGTWYWAYYYIDDVNVYLCDDTSVPAPPSFPEILLTPNPNNSMMQLSGNFPANTKLEFYNTLGQLVNSNAILEGNRQQNIHIPQLAEGLYFYYISSGDLELKSGKVIISK